MRRPSPPWRMAHHQLGHHDEARASLDSARAIIANKPPDALSGAFWFDWLHCEILCREAETLVRVKCQLCPPASFPAERPPSHAYDSSREPWISRHGGTEGTERKASMGLWITDVAIGVDSLLNDRF